MKDGKFKPIDDALDELSWQWLSDTHPLLAAALQAAVDKGVEPDEIRWYVMRKTERRELALRCEQAAAFLATG